MIPHGEISCGAKMEIVNKQEHLQTTKLKFYYDNSYINFCYQSYVVANKYFSRNVKAADGILLIYVDVGDMIMN